MPKLVWRVKLVAELEPGVTTETEVARLERDEEAGLADLGLRLDEAKQLTAALQAEMVPAQVTVVGERRRSCAACGRRAGQQRPLQCDVPLPVRRRAGPGPAAARLSLPGPGRAEELRRPRPRRGTVAPELAYVTARYAALAPFGKVAALLSELLPISGAQNAGTVRNRTLRVGEAGRAAAPHRDGEADHSAGGRPRRGRA